MTSGTSGGARGATTRVLIELVRAGGPVGMASERLANVLGHAVDTALAEACVAALAGGPPEIAWGALDDELFAAVLEAAQALDRGSVVAAALADAASSKARAKLVKAAAHRLRSRGVEVPVATAAPTHARVALRPASDPDAERRSIISAPDGQGGRLVVVVADRADGVLFVESIFRDDVLVRVAGDVMPRKKSRPLVARLFETWGDALASVDVAIGAAEILAADADGRIDTSSLREWLAELRPQLEPLVGEARRLPEPSLDPEALRRRATESASLLDRTVFQSWMPDRRALLDCGEKLHVAVSSDLVISEAQRAEQLASVFTRAAREYLTDAQRRAFVARLRHASRFLLVREDVESAERAWATAQMLEEGGVPPLVEQLFRRVFERSMPEQPAAAEPATEAPQSRLILPGAPEPGTASRGGLILP